MESKYYTVEQAAQLLDMHPKTIQRYIREGRLKATKLGKSWRITGHDLSVFVEGVPERAPQLSIPIPPEDRRPPRMSISVVVDIDVDAMQDAVRIANTLTAAMNSKPPEYGQTSLSTQFLPSENKLRVLFWGDVPTTEVLLSYLSALSQPAE